jgi:hypothetical protein
MGGLPHVSARVITYWLEGEGGAFGEMGCDLLGF